MPSTTAPHAPPPVPLRVKCDALWLTHTTPHTRVREVALCGDLVHTNRRSLRRALMRFGVRCPKTHEEKARADLLVLGQRHDSELLQRFQARAQPVVSIEAFLPLVGHPLDANAFLAQLRAIVHRPPDRQAWAELVALLDRWPADASPELGARYAEDHLAAWPDALRTTPKHWFARAMRGEPTPWIRLARDVAWWPRDGRRSGNQNQRLSRLLRAFGDAPLTTLNLNFRYNAQLDREMALLLTQAPCAQTPDTLMFTGDARYTSGLDTLHGWRAFNHARDLHLGLYSHGDATFIPLIDSLHRAVSSTRTPPPHPPEAHPRIDRFHCIGSSATPAASPVLADWADRARPRDFTFGSEAFTLDDYRALQRMGPFADMRVVSIHTDRIWNSLHLTHRDDHDDAA